MAEQCYEQMQLPLTKASGMMAAGYPSAQASTLPIKAAQFEPHRHPCGMDAIKPTSPSNRGRYVRAHVTQGDLDQSIEKVLGDDGVMAQWDPKAFKKIKTLAAAASGDGSVVLMASRQNPGQMVAVKRLPWDIIRSSPDDFSSHHADAIERPWTDIAIVKHLSNLQVPWGCQFLGVFNASNHVYIMTSLATRGDLFSWIEKDESKPGEEREAAIRPIASQMFAAVCCLHNMGIAHRDLSAENVMLTDSGEKGVQVKIIDYGMATLDRTASKEVRGKRSYQAPEMHTGDQYDTFLVDNFALGVILYCMGAHYYPWGATAPGKDRSCEFARANGVETFLNNKRLPCCKIPFAQVFSKPLLELVCGLLDFDPEARYCLGEVCFCKNTRKETAFMSQEGYAASDISTATSLDSLPCEKTVLESLPPFPGKATLSCGSLPSYAASATPSLESLPPVERILNYPGTASMDSLPPFPTAVSLESLPPFPATASLESLPPMERFLAYPGTASVDSLPAFPGTASLGQLPVCQEEDSEEESELECSEDDEASECSVSRVTVWDNNWLQA